MLGCSHSVCARDAKGRRRGTCTVPIPLPHPLIGSVPGSLAGRQGLADWECWLLCAAWDDGKSGVSRGVLLACLLGLIYPSTSRQGIPEKQVISLVTLPSGIFPEGNWVQRGTACFSQARCHKLTLIASVIPRRRRPPQPLRRLQGALLTLETSSRNKE